MSASPDHEQGRQPSQSPMPDGSENSATEIATQAADQVRSAAGDVAEGVTNLASEAKAEVANLKAEAVQHARGAIGDASSQAREHATQQTERAAVGLDQLSQQLRALAEGRVEDAGPAVHYARQAGDRLAGAAERLQSGGVDGVMQDLSSFARRKPGQFLFAAGLAGFVAGRLIKGAQGNSSTPVGGQQLTASTTSTHPNSGAAVSPPIDLGSTGSTDDVEAGLQAAEDDAARLGVRKVEA